MGSHEGSRPGTGDGRPQDTPRICLAVYRRRDDAAAGLTAKQRQKASIRTQPEAAA